MNGKKRKIRITTLVRKNQNIKKKSKKKQKPSATNA